MEEKMKRNKKDGGFSSPRPEKRDRRMAAAGWVNRRKVFAPLGAGGTHCQHDRQQEDYYATHPIAAQQLLKVETFSRNIWECACGDGHLAKVFASAGYKVRATDLVKRGYRCGKLDFLKCTTLWPGDIITNPPYKYAEAFIATALQLIPEGNKLALFLKLQFLEGKKRKSLFTTYPPKVLYVSSSRIPCAMNGVFGGASSAMAFGWYVWVKGFRGDPIIKWIN